MVVIDTIRYPISEVPSLVFDGFSASEGEMVCQGILPAISLATLINCRVVLAEHHSCLTYIMTGKWSSFSQLGGMFPSKMITYLDYNLLV